MCAEINKMERQFNKIAVTDAMVKAVCDAGDFNEIFAEGLLKRVLATGGLGMVRAKGSYHSPSQLAALEAGQPADDELRTIRMQIVSEMMRSGAYSSNMIDQADNLAQYVLTGKKPGEK